MCTVFTKNFNEAYQYEDSEFTYIDLYFRVELCGWHTIMKETVSISIDGRNTDDKIDNEIYQYIQRLSPIYENIIYLGMLKK